MINHKKIAIVMPAYNAELTLKQTFSEIPRDVVDHVILVDDASTDQTITEAESLGIKHIIRHERNTGYGGNQKSCYRTALELGADIVIMVHPDYQYTPKLIRPMASMIAEGLYDCVLGSRVLGRGALKGGMPLYKYVANRLLSLIQNFVTGQKLSEYHSGYRAYSRELLEAIPIAGNSDDFIFDNQFLLQIIAADYKIGEVSCPTRYIAESSSIQGIPLIKYGLSVLLESFIYLTTRVGGLKTRYSTERNP